MLCVTYMLEPPTFSISPRVFPHSSFIICPSHLNSSTFRSSSNHPESSQAHLDISHGKSEAELIQPIPIPFKQQPGGVSVV